MLIDPAQLDLQNMWLSDANELMVRPALLDCGQISDYTYNAEFIAGFSLRSPNTGDVAHYLVVRKTTTGVATVYITEEELTRVKTSFSIGVIPPNAVVSLSSINDPTTANLELLITSPSFDSIYGIIGGGLKRASKVESVNYPNTSAIDIPRGISTTFADRVVIGNGKNLYFSDVQAPQTFVANNIAALPGNVTFLGTLGNGSLLIITDNGSYTLAPDAAYSDTDVLGLFEQLEDFSSQHYNKAVISQGVPYGLSQNGVKQLTAGLPETALAEKRMHRVFSTPITTADFRGLNIFPTDRGFVVSQEFAWCMLDTSRNFKSWWTTPTDTNYNIVGVLTECDGSNLFVTPEYILKPFGDEEFGGNSVSGKASGIIPTPSNASPVVREVTGASDTNGDINIAVRGVASTAKSVPQRGPTVGTDAWSDTNTFKEKEIRSRRFQFKERTDEVGIEIKVDRCYSRIGSIFVDMRGQGKRRPTN